MFAQTLTIASLAAAAMAQSTTSAPSAASAETTITALFGTATTGFVGSIIGANACETTMALVCDTSDSTTPNDVCAQVPDVTATVVVGPSAYEFEYATSTLGAQITLKQDCDLAGPSGSFTAATCTASVYGSAAGASTSTQTVVTETNSAFFQYAAIPITAGASKLPSAGATCDAAAQSSVDAAQTTSSGSAAAPTVMAELYKILVPVGAAVVAGAGAML